MGKKTLLTINLIKIIIVVLAFLLNIKASGYYVADPRGNDGVAGTDDDRNSSDTYPGTFSQPFATITKTCNTAFAGDTVYIIGGVYNQILRPRQSGTPDSPIVFTNYDTTAVVIKDTPGLSNVTQDEQDADQEGRQYGIYLYGLSYVIIQGLHVTEVSGWMRAVRCDHITFQNNTCTKALSTGTTGSIKFLFSDKNKVLNNTIQEGNDNLLLIHSDSNLVAGNHMVSGRHSLWCIRAGNFNVIRNNYFHNEIQKIGEIYDAENDPPLIFDTTKYNLVEGNQFAKTPSSGNASPYAGIQFAGQRCIIRKNMFYETVGPGFDLTLYSDEARYNYENRIYHNVFYKTDFAGVHISGATSYTFHDNILKNNIFFQSVFMANDERWSWYTEELDGKPVQVLTGRREGFLFENNNFFNQAADELYLITYGSRTSTSNPQQHEVTWWEDNYPDLFQNNLEKNPQFVNAANHDFHLQDSSQMIDAGMFLTYTRGQGNGTVLPVIDVKYFYSGFGIEGEAGDQIQLAGQNQTARITAINYDSSLLVLDQALTWTDSLGVSLMYAGNAPDVGAYEYSTTPVISRNNRSRHSNNDLSILPCFNKRQLQITFNLPCAQEVHLSFFTLHGTCIKIVNLGKRPSGLQTVILGDNLSGASPSLLSSGIYIIRLQSTSSLLQTKLFYLR